MKFRREILDPMYYLLNTILYRVLDIRVHTMPVQDVTENLKEALKVIMIEAKVNVRVKAKTPKALKHQLTYRGSLHKHT